MLQPALPPDLRHECLIYMEHLPNSCCFPLGGRKKLSRNKVVTQRANKIITLSIQMGKDINLR